jgi:hypothetical protein
MSVLPGIFWPEGKIKNNFFTFSSPTQIACRLKTTSACRFRDLYIAF